MLQGVKRELFREPRGGRCPWVWLLIGCIAIVIGLFFYSPLEGQFPQAPLVAIGLMFVFQGAVKVLPRDRTTIAGGLRVGQFLAIVYVLVVMVAYLWSRAS